MLILVKLDNGRLAWRTGNQSGRFELSPHRTVNRLHSIKRERTRVISDQVHLRRVDGFNGRAPFRSFAYLYLTAAHLAFDTPVTTARGKESRWDRRRCQCLFFLAYCCFHLIMSMPTRESICASLRLDVYVPLFLFCCVATVLCCAHSSTSRSFVNELLLRKTMRSRDEDTKQLVHSRFDSSEMSITNTLGTTAASSIDESMGKLPE